VSPLRVEEQAAQRDAAFRPGRVAPSVGAPIGGEHATGGRRKSGLRAHRQLKELTKSDSEQRGLVFGHAAATRSFIGLVRGMLDHCHHAAGHEPPGANRLAGSSDLGDLDHSASGRHLDPPAGPRGNDLVRSDAVTGVHHDLDPVPSHRSNRSGSQAASLRFRLRHTTRATAAARAPTAAFAADESRTRSATPAAGPAIRLAGGVCGALG
jgi:hypothetical protein